MNRSELKTRLSSLGRRLWVWPEMGLGLKLAFMVVVGLVSLIGLFGYMGTAALNENIERSLDERVVLAQTMARHIDYLLANVEHVMVDAARQEALRDPARREQTLQSIYSYLSFYGNQLLFVDADGRVAAAYPPLPSGLDLAQAESVQAVRMGQAFAISSRAEALGPASKSPLAAAPVRDAQGQLLGALVLGLDFYRPNLPAFTHPVGLGATGYVDLVDAEGLILGSTRPQYIGKTSDHNTTLAEMIRAGQNSVSRCHDCHEPASGAAGTPAFEPADATVPEQQVMAFAPLSRVPWGVTVRQNEDEVLATVSELRLRVFLVGMIALAGALGLVYLTSRSVIRPVQALTAAARRMAGGDLDTPIRLSAKDEVGELANAFSAMRVQLKDSIAQITAFNRELDARVQERTAALEAAQREAQVSREHLQTIIDSLGDELVVVDRDYRVTRVNAVVEQAHPPGTPLIGARCYELTHSGERCHAPDCECPLPQVFQTGKRQKATHVHGRNGEMRYLELIASPLRDPSGQVSGVVELLRDVTDEKRVELENARLYEELSRKEEQRGELVRRLISAQEDERKRIARELHDDTSQILTTLLFTVDTLAEAYQPPDGEPLLDDMRALTVNALNGIHNLIFDLRPTMLDQLGLVAALRSYAHGRLAESGVEVECTERGRVRRLPWAVETALFRAVQEAINNIARHAEARHVTMTFDFSDGLVEIRIEDDGRGFDVKQIAAERDPRRGLGLMSMEERVTAVGGEFFLDSHPGRGTVVRARVPIEEFSDGSNQSPDR